jgi:hypothetical protein
MLNLFNKLSRILRPSPARIIHSSPTTAAFRSNRLAKTVGVMGLVISGANLYDSLKERDYKMAGLDAVTLFTGTAETVKTIAPCIVANSRMLSNLVRYNEVVTIATGAFEIAHEKPGYKLQRAGAVIATTAAGLGGGAFLNALNGGSALAMEASSFGSALLAVTPILAVAAGTAAVALTVEAAIAENKARDAFNRSVTERENIACDTALEKQWESSGCPALQKYKNLLKLACAFARACGQKPEEAERCAYSEKPQMLVSLAKICEKKIAAFDTLIAENTPWYGTSGAADVLMGRSPKTKRRCAAQLARAHYVAAAKELCAYQEEIENYKNPHKKTAIEKTENPSFTNWDDRFNLRIHIRQPFDLVTPHTWGEHNFAIKPMLSPI